MRPAALFVIAVVAVLLCVPVGASMDYGPHNHNGNRFMDIYAEPGGDWNGSIRAVIADVNDTPDPQDMPLARRVGTLREADVEFVRTPDLLYGGTFAHRRDGPDRIRIGILVEGGDNKERVYIHELRHAYGGSHKTEEECQRALLWGGSVMCPWWANPHHLTRYDEAEMRALPNEWQGPMGTSGAVR